MEAIWHSDQLYQIGVGKLNFLKDGRHETRLIGNTIYSYDLLSGKETEIIFSPGYALRIQGYQFSDDEQRILIETEQEAIYRRSKRSAFYVWDRSSKSLYPVSSEGKQMHATFSPDGTQVAFVRGNNLFISEYLSGQEIQVTTDGQPNSIINGSSDWVYEEEFKLVRGFEWSPDGTRIAFYRFDESNVPEILMTRYNDDIYPEWSSFKYPKVGQAMSTIDILIYDLASGKTTKLDLGPINDQYIPRITFTTSSDHLCVTRLDRAQQELTLLLFNLISGTSQNILVETNPDYISIHDHLHFLPDGKRFIWVSEVDGWSHIYVYNISEGTGKLLTSGDWDVTDVYGVDDKRGEIWFQSAQESPLNREICHVSIQDAKVDILPFQSGFNEVILSPSFDYIVRSQSTLNTPIFYEIANRNGQSVRMLVDNHQLVEKQRKFRVQPVESFSFHGASDTLLYGWMIKPPEVDSIVSHPLLMYVYGGPNRQEAANEWIGQYYWWFQYLVSKGFVVAAVDGRGSGARGEHFRKMTTLQLGHYETIDQIAAARYLGAQSDIDEGRIGIFGWSYGGYLSTLCLLKGNDVFRAGIAVAPVTNWKWYDAIYTERYMQTIESNPIGYAENSPVYFADQLKGDYLLIHGMADDNVHFQHSAEMARALVTANKQFETSIYINYDHNISGGNAQLHLYTKMTDFLIRSLQLDED